ncbi:hypothetical protein SPD53_15445 [Oceanobacillus sp. MO10714A]
MIKVLELMTNPMIQNLLTNFIYSGIQKGGKKLISDNLSQQFETAILDAFDKFSEKYPIISFQKEKTYRQSENLKYTLKYLHEEGILEQHIYLDFSKEFRKSYLDISDEQGDIYFDLYDINQETYEEKFSEVEELFRKAQE